MLTQEPENPFQSPETVSHVADVEQQHTQNDLAWATGKAALRWFLICSVSAAPSWYIAAGATSAAIAGMATGVFLFIVGYTIFDVWTRNHPLRQRRDVKITLAITYGTRIAISLLFPIGFFVDIFCGIIAVSATGFVFQTTESNLQFVSTLVTTLVQGVLLNCVLAGYGLLVYAVCRGVLAMQGYQETVADR